jgi:hypothetical protein
MYLPPRIVHNVAGHFSERATRRAEIANLHRNRPNLQRKLNNQNIHAFLQNKNKNIKKKKHEKKFTKSR